MPLNFTILKAIPKPDTELEDIVVIAAINYTRCFAETDVIRSYEILKQLFMGYSPPHLDENLREFIYEVLYIPEQACSAEAVRRLGSNNVILFFKLGLLKRLGMHLNRSRLSAEKTQEISAWILRHAESLRPVHFDLPVQRDPAQFESMVIHCLELAIILTVHKKRKNLHKGYWELFEVVSGVLGLLTPIYRSADFVYDLSSSWRRNTEKAKCATALRRHIDQLKESLPQVSSSNEESDGKSSISQTPIRSL